MEIRQIFSEYDHNNTDIYKDIKYCPRCGNLLEYKLKDGKTRPVCPKCKYVYYKNPLPAVSVLIMENNQILLGKRGKGSFKKGKWCLPCGFIEYDENFLMSAKREVLEETGLNIKVTSIINVAYNYLSPDLHTIVIVILGEVKCGKLKPGDDITELMWCDIGKPLPSLAFVSDEYIIQRYIQEKICGIEINTKYEYI